MVGEGDGAMISETEKATVGLTATRYSPAILEMFDRERHMPLSDAYALVDAQSDPNLPRTKLEHAVESGDVAVYEFKGVQYVDRLDIGRVYHRPTERRGLHIERYFSTEGQNPFGEVVEMEEHDLEILDVAGTPIFRMQGAKFSKGFTRQEAAIVAQKYFFNPHEPAWGDRLEEKIGVRHENSFEQLVRRVSDYFADEGWKLGYFETEADREAFREELVFLQATRKAAFNSPAYFNAGLYNSYGIEGTPALNFWRNPETGEVIRIRGGCNIKPQNHACFIRSPTDHLPSILAHHADEGSIFANGSGVGGLLHLREEGAQLSGGGEASGPLSFLKCFDDDAGTIKSGGKSRRAARLQCMRQSHPDIEKFILAKVKEDHKALVLMRAGYSGGMDGEAYTTVTFQNTNFSARLRADFFKQVKNNGTIKLRRVVDGTVVREASARDMLQKIAWGAWRVGDPGVQYESRIEEDNTCSNSAGINASNPCSEYMGPNDTSCNLVSLRLTAFADDAGNFDVRGYRAALRIMATAQAIANHCSSYPVEDIARISPEFAAIGTGFADLGGLLMRRGVKYDSDEGRALGAGLAAITTGAVYEASIEMAGKMGAFTQFEFNRGPMLRVMRKHQSSLDQVAWQHVPDEIRIAAHESWDAVVKGTTEVGHHVSQASALAPTGTISFMMGCDTPGMEPAISLQIRKDLAGGGTMVMTLDGVQNSLRNLGYNELQQAEIQAHIAKHNTTVGAPHLHPDHVGIFATSFGNSEGVGAIPFEGHIRMVGALQPFVSGGISKTNNLPKEATVKQVYEGFILGHELGLKGLTVFRRGSKPVSALNFGGESFVQPGRGEKEDLPSRRIAFESEVELPSPHGPVPFHVIVGEYDDGRPGQIAFLCYKAGTTLQALLTTEGISASKALKRGVHLRDVISCWRDQKFDPGGTVIGHPHIKRALSPLDFAARLLALEYLGETDASDVQDVDRSQLRGAQNGAFATFKAMEIDDWDMKAVLRDPDLGGFVPKPKDEEKPDDNGHSGNHKNTRGLACDMCGNIMTQTGPSCYECQNCSKKVGGCGG